MDQSVLSGRGHVSVLGCFPTSVGRDVAVAVVKPLGVCLGNPDTRSLLRTDKQVKWTMEVLCCGLTLPLDGDTVALCVDIYTDWLMALVVPRDSIPPPIIREPNIYGQKILRHLYNFFLPRSDQSSPLYLSLCEQVLSSLQRLARESTVMSQDTWETLLQFLLRINHSILSPPTTAGDIDNLSHLSMAVLFEVWLLACSKCFPSRLLWQTCQNMVSSWRHQPAVVDQWSRVIAALTSRLLPLRFGPSFPLFQIPEEDAALVPSDMEKKRIPQTWFRFLHMFSNPVDLIGPAGVIATPLAQEEIFRGGDSQLPHIFLTAMKVISMLVDAFLGLTVTDKSQTEQLPPSTGLSTKLNFRDRLPSLGVAVTRSPFKDRLPSSGVSRPRSGSAPPTPVGILSLSASSLPTSSWQRPTNISKATSKSPVPPISPHHRKSFSHPPPPSIPLCSSPRSTPSHLRCNIDSLLHLFGCWLFDASLLSRDRCPSERMSAGRAEACGTLCRIFSCKKTVEDILPVYLSRFYMVLLQGLQLSDEFSPPVLASILLNSSSLFSCDLKGVNMLLPSFISALEKVLLDREQVMFKSFVRAVDLRRASVLILLSLVPLPLQFGSVQLQVLFNDQFGGEGVAGRNFLSLRPRLIGVLIGALQTETNSANVQMILGAMLNLVQDLALFEADGKSLHEAPSYHAGPRRVRRTAGSSRTREATGILWVQLVRLLTSQLTAQWRNDLAICLSTLEVLGGLAKVEVNVDDSEKWGAVSSICHYIEFQCSRPPPLHSRDLHSIIVAAFYCLNIWLTQHPTLLEHQGCLSEVLEIVELGISGSKSKQEQEVRCKEVKGLNPASLRVKEAAEATLSFIMQASGSLPLMGGSLDEDALMNSGSSGERGQGGFKYFVVNSSVVLAMLEHQPGPEQEGLLCPSFTVLIRGPSTRNAWTLQHRLQPRHTKSNKQACAQNFTPSVDTSHQVLTQERRSEAQEDAGIQHGVIYPLLPENMEKVPSVKADHITSALHENLSAEMRLQLRHLWTTLKRQQQVEAQPQVSSHSVAMTTCRPPPPANHCQAARLFLSHLGFLTPETLKDPGTSGVPAQLVSLDSSLPGFSEDLKLLDQLPSRNRDCAFVFYVRAGQRTSAEILKSVESRQSVSSHFLDFLSTIGRPVEVGDKEAGRSGANKPDFCAVLGNSGGCVFDGEKFLLMYADALAEIIFILPSSSSHSDRSKSTNDGESATELPSRQRSHSEFGLNRASGLITALDGSRSSRSPPSSPVSDATFVIVWAEHFEDTKKFPVSELLVEKRGGTQISNASNFQIIFIHPLKTGLYKIGFQGNFTSKFGLVGPLVNGSVVSKRSLGILVRETVANCCLRRRLDSDSSPPPHVRRKHLIKDIVLRYRCNRSEPAFYSALFQNP